MTTTQEIGRRIRTRRAWLGIKSGDFSDKAGIAKPTLSNIEAGRQGASAINMMKIAAELGVSIDFLMTGKGGPQYD